jgi:hypothetical protein
MSSVMYNRWEFKWGTHNEGHIGPSAVPIFQHHTVSQVYLTLRIKGLIMTTWPCSSTETPKWNTYCYDNTHLSPMTQKVVNEISCYKHPGFKAGHEFSFSYMSNGFLPQGYIHDYMNWPTSSNPHTHTHTHKSQTSHCLMVLQNKCPTTIRCKA